MMQTEENSRVPLTRRRRKRMLRTQQQPNGDVMEEVHDKERKSKKIIQ